MNPQDTKLQRILDLAKVADTLTATQAKQFVELLVNLTNKQKEELVSKSNEFADTVSQETYRKLNEAIAIISEKHKDAMLEVRQLTNKQKDAHNAKMSELEGVIAELKAIEIRDGVDGADADEEVIVEKVLAKIPTPKEVVLDDADAIIEKINTTKGKIEAKTIRGLVETIDNISKSNIGNIPRIAPSILEILSNGTNVQQGATRLNFLGGAVYNNGTIDIPAPTGTITGSGTSGQVSFWNGTSSIAGDNNFFWDNTNKRLGIGTTTPVSKLSVTDSTSARGAFLDVNTVASHSGLWLGANNLTPSVSNYNFLSNGTSLFINRPTGGSIDFRQNNTTQMTILTSGNVGIGTTTTPTEILTFGNGTARKIWVENSALGTSGRPLTVSAGSTIDGSPNVNGGNLILQSGLATGVSASSILFQTGTTLAGGSTLQTYSTKMIIQGNGSVGIANDTPFTGLSGMLGVDIGVFNTAGAEGNLMVRGFASLGGLARGGYGGVGSNYYLDTSGTVRRRFNDTVSVLGFASGGFQFFTSGSGAVASNITFTELARLNTNGNFLLGTTTDSGFKLDVVGTFRSSGSATIGGNIALTGGAKINFATGGGFIEGADTYLRFATNAGTERARINNAGNFGIGTASPFSTLHVSDTSGAGIYVERVATPSTTSGGAVTILNNGSAPIIGQRLGGLYMGDTTLGGGGSAAIMGFADGTFSTGVIPGSLRFYTTGASGATLNERMRIDSLGNVGIGATAPTFRLQVEENTNGNGGMFVRNSNTGTSTIAAINVAANTGNTSLRTYSSTHSVFPLTGGFFTDSSLTGGMLIFNGANAPTMFYTNNSERMRITSTGNVGIGATAPTSKLTIADTTLAGSGSLAGSALSISQTWNTTGNPTGFFMNITNTASGATSLLMDLRLTNVSQFNVDRDGKLTLSAGVNKSTGQATLSSGTVTVSNTEVTANSKIYYSVVSVNGSSTVGNLTTSAKVAGTSFTITSVKHNNPSTTETADNSIIDWWIIN